MTSSFLGGLLSKKWKEYRFILYDSSLLTWYSDIKHRKPDGMVLLKVGESNQYVVILSNFSSVGRRKVYLCWSIHEVR